MPDAYLQGILGAYDSTAQVKNDISVVAINWFANRCPLVTRSPRLPISSTSFTIVSRTYRSRSAVVNAAIANNVINTITVVDASNFMQGDVLQLASGEVVQVIADPDVTNNVLTVTRGVSGTAAAQNNGTSILLLGNARTGSEVNQSAVGFKPTGVAQYCQTFQHPVQVGGSTQAQTGFITEPGVSTPFDQYKMDALQNLMDDMEVSSYYGPGVAPTSGGRPIQKGLSTLITTGNVTSSPVNAGAYKPTDLIRDTLQKARTGGGNPDLMLVSTNFMTGFATWGHAVQRLDAGETSFGTPIDLFEAPFLTGVAIVEAPLLQSYTAIALTSQEVRMRMKRNEFWNPRGIRGDAIEGDWIAEGAIEVDNPAHHAMVSGITAFSAT